MTLATLGPVGFLRPAPGSWGSAAALVMGAGLAFLSPRLLEIAALVDLLQLTTPGWIRLAR